MNLRKMRNKLFTPDEDQSEFINKDQKDFRLIVLLSFLIHGLFLFSLKTATIPTGKHHKPASSPERTVNLIIKPKSITIQKNGTENHWKIVPYGRNIRQQAAQQTDLKSSSSSKKPVPQKENKSAIQKKSRPKKLPQEIDAHPRTKKSASSAQTQKKEVSNIPKNKEKIEEKSSSPQKVASLDKRLNSSPKPPPKIDLNSMGILGMISSRESSRSSSPVNSQLDLLTNQAIRSGKVENTEKKSILKHIEVMKNLTALGDEFTGEIDDQPAHEPLKTELAKNIDDMVAENQQTDNVDLPSLGDVAFQKILEVKTSGPKNKFRTSEAILEVASSYKAGITHCYNKALKAYPNLKGRIIVEFSIAADGKISQIRIIASTLNIPHSGLEECVIHMIQHWRFTKIPEGSTTVIYPFVFFPVL